MKNLTTEDNITPILGNSKAPRREIPIHAPEIRRKVPSTLVKRLLKLLRDSFCVSLNRRSSVSIAVNLSLISSRNGIS